MNQQALEVLASQHRAELRDNAAHVRKPQRFFTDLPRQSVRERTGWTLVDLGLKLVAEHSRAASPRPAGS
jgi:hypothetical protein